jgi:hypothetical protein
MFPLKLFIHALHHGSSYILKQQKGEPCNTFKWFFLLQRIYVMRKILLDKPIPFITMVLQFIIFKEHNYELSYISPLSSPPEVNITSSCLRHSLPFMKIESFIAVSRLQPLTLFL